MMMLFTCGLSAFAEGGSATVTVDTVTVAQGEIAEVAVSIANNPGLHAFSFTIGYDPAFLTAQDVKSALSGSFDAKIAPDGEKGKILVTFTSDAAGDLSEDGALFTMKFLVGLENRAGKTPISIAGSMTNAAEEEVPATLAAGAVDITALEYTVTVENDGNGSASAAKETYHFGDTVNLTANPNLNCTFKTWMSGDGVTFQNATAAKTSFTMPAKNVTVHASCINNTSAELVVNLTVTPTAGGTATADRSAYAVDDAVHLDAVPADGYYFKEWKSEDVTIGTPQTPSADFNMPAKDVAVTAVFEPLLPNRYALTANSTAGGTVTYNSIANYFNSGSQVILTATPSTNYAFKEWRIDDGDVYIPDKTDPVLEFGMPQSDVRLTAVFEYNPGKKYTVKAQSAGGGTAESVKREYAAGERVVITATPRLGYVFYNWESADNVTFLNPSTASTSFIMPPRNVTVVANFAINPYLGGGGTGGGSTGGSTGGNTTTTPPTNNILTVNFDSQGGTPVSSISVYSGGQITAPEAPTRDGYEFGGWYTQATCVDAYNFSVAVTKSFTLYARWLPLEQNERFFDVKRTDWFYEAVHALVDRGIVNGITYNKFAPQDNVTRAQFVQMLARASGADLSTYTCEFEDVATSDWFYPAVAWASSMGVVGGISETHFAPNALISRQDMALMLSRYISKVANTTLQESPYPIPFNDDANIADYARDAVMSMKNAGVIGGKLNNRFAPRENATRAEAAKIIHTMLTKTGK